MLRRKLGRTLASAHNWLRRWRAGQARSGSLGQLPHDGRRQTVLNSPHVGEDGVVAFRLPAGHPARLVYSVAQQALLGQAMIDRYLSGGMSGPYAEFIDPASLTSPAGDAVAEQAAAWLSHNACDIAGDGAVWRHDFDMIYTDGAAPIAAPWISAVGQANALLACLHWWRHTGEPRWRELASRAVTPFLRPLDRDAGVAASLGGDEVWFEEYPLAAPPHVLNCHLLSLIALDRAAADLNLPAAERAFESGWRALRRRIGLYDRGDWSRYDLYQRLFLMVRLVPSVRGTTAWRNIEVRTAAGRRLARLAYTAEPHDRPESRLAGGDWGPAGEFAGRTGRAITNRQAHYAGNVPLGGTDQNTYLIIEEEMPSAPWQEHGLQLHMDAFFGDGAELELEFRDPRHEGLVFRRESSVPALSGSGWGKFRVDIPPRLIGHPLPRHYHRLHVELLGTLLERHPDPALQEVFQRWHVADLNDIPGTSDLVPPRPHGIYVFVNSRCNLRCRMCDIGEKAPSTFQRNMQMHGDELPPDVLLDALRRDAAGLEGTNLHLVGTEPLLYRRLGELLSGAKALGLRTAMTTNGLLLEKQAQQLAAARLDAIAVSLDGPPEVHDEIRGRPGLFDRVVRGIAALRRACEEVGVPTPHLDIGCAISYDNHRRLLALLEAVRPLNPRSVAFSHLNFVTPAAAERHSRRFPEYPIAASSVAAWKKTAEMDFLALFLELEEVRRVDWTQVAIIPHCPTPTRLRWYYLCPELPMSRQRCAAPENCIQVRCDGTVGVLGRCFERTMGDLANESVAAVWNGGPYREFRDFVRQNLYLEPCLRCCGSL